jgi:hypothetical protein
MTEPIITCPVCKAEIKLTESLAAPIIESTRRQYEEKLAHQEDSIRKRERALHEQGEALERARESIEEQVASKLKSERARIAQEESKKARLILENDMNERLKEIDVLKDILKQRDEKLAEAQRAQAEIVRKQRDLDDARREMELTIEKRVGELLLSTREKAKREAEEELKLKVAERDQTIASMQKQIEELKKRAEQGSQQLQGEVLELEIELVLRGRFPHDLVEPVPKGEHGGDLLHRVFSPYQQPCGTILWESKRTKNWSDGWLSKLRDDQRTAKAEFAVIVSSVLPRGVDVFDLVDGIWVTSHRTVIPVAIALRHSLIELAMARQAGEGQQTKMEMIYQYLTGPRFRHRVQAIVEKFTEMQQDLGRERKTLTKLWAKREEQMRCVVESTAGMYGDLQGIAGKTLQGIEGLEVKMLESGEPTS